jgi:LacI family transcriptional regulator
VRLRDVAKAAGVDASVVSRVLSGDARLAIRPETRERVLAEVARLEYRPNPAARTLKTSRTKAIGMLVPDLANVNYATIARGALEAAEVHGYVVLVAHGSPRARLQDLHGRVDGLIVGMATAETPRHDLFNPAVPTLLVNRQEPCGVPSVTVDDEAGAALATEYLLSLGHRRVAHVAGPQNADTARRRLAGYRRAMGASGIELPPDYVVETSFNEAGGHMAAGRLLERGDRPTALFVGNVQAALGALASVSRLGLRVPDDVSVVAFHDAPFAAYLEPALTTVRMPLEEMGRHAVERLLALLAGDAVDDVQLPTTPELVVRASTARLAG